MTRDGTPPRPNTFAVPADDTAAPPPRARFDDEIDVTWVFRAIARRWKALLTIVAIGAGLVAIVVSRTPRLYEAAVTLAVSGPPAGVGLSNASSFRTLITSPTVLAEAASAIDAGNPPVLRPDAIFVDPVPNTALLRLRVRLDDPQHAARAGAVLGERGSTLSREIHQKTSRLDRDGVPARLAAAKTKLAETEQHLLDFRQRSKLEVLRSDVDALLEQRKTAQGLPLAIEIERGRLAAAQSAIGGDATNQATSGTSALAREAAQSRGRLATLERTRQQLESALRSREIKQLNELYSLERDLSRLETEHEAARKIYVDLAVRAQRGAVASRLAIPTVQVVETAGLAAYEISRGRLQKVALGAFIALLAGIALIVVLEAVSRKPVALSPEDENVHDLGSRPL